MTVALTACRVSYAGDDVTEQFPTTFKFLASSDLVVEQSTDAGVHWSLLSEGVDYSVIGAGTDEPGGQVALAAGGLPSGTLLRITRSTQLVQPVLLQQSGAFPPKSIMTEMDRLTLIVQEQARRIASLEAGTTGGAYTAFQIQADFTLTAPLEGNFPMLVPAGLIAGTCVLGRVENLDTPGEVLDDPPSIQWAQSGDDISLTRVSGLTIGQHYRLTFEVRGVGA